jgi:hypothetical protein
VTGAVSVTIGTKPADAAIVVVVNTVPQVAARRASGAEYLLRTNLPAPGNLNESRSRKQGFRDDLCLILHKTAEATAWPSQDLGSSEVTLRVILNVRRNNSSKTVA